MKKAYIFKGRDSRMMNNRKGSSYMFIYGLAFAFILALLYIVFNQILNVYLYPTTQFISGGDTAEADNWLGFWGMVPYMIVFIIALFMYFRLTQSQTGE